MTYTIPLRAIYILTHVLKKFDIPTGLKLYIIQFPSWLESRGGDDGAVHYLPSLSLSLSLFLSVSQFSYLFLISAADTYRDGAYICIIPHEFHDTFLDNPAKVVITNYMLI